MPLEASAPPALLGGKYRLERPIGRGGMGVVYLATHVLTGRAVAVKVLHRARGPAFASLLHEARAAARIEHPNIVSVLDVGSEDAGRDDAWLVLELLRGETLAERLTRGPLGAAAALLALTPVMDALAVAHGRGIVHRDVKPANVFLHVDGVGRVVPKLLDFGIAMGPDDDAPGRGLTRRYAAPEQLRAASSIGPAADVHAMALVVLEAVTGDLDLLGSELPDGFRPILQRALERDPGARPTMRALAEALIGALPPSAHEAKLEVRVGAALGRQSTLHTTAIATVETQVPVASTKPKSFRLPLGLALAAGLLLLGARGLQRRTSPPVASAPSVPSVSSVAAFTAAVAGGACAPAPIPIRLGERRVLGSSTDRWCVLAAVHGALDEPARSVGVEANEGQWVGWASGGTHPLEIEARCLPLACVVADDTRRYVSSPLTLSEKVEGECSSAVGESYWGDAATVLERLDGRFAAASDYLEVLQSSEGRTASRLRLRGCRGPWLGGGSHAFFAGKHAAGVPARFVGGEYTSTGTPLELAKADEAFCFLTRVAGPLLDEHGAFGLSLGGKGARRWTLTAQKESVRARCYALDQRRPGGGTSP